MTAIADTGPGQLIRWHYLGYAVVALGVMTVAIVSHDHWFLNFVHVTLGSRPGRAGLTGQSQNGP